jgi:hypothetical protein
MTGGQPTFVNSVHAEPQMQTIGGLWTLEVWVSRLRGHPEGPEAMSDGCSTVVPGFNVLGTHGSAGADGLIKELEGQILLQAQLLESLEIMERQSQVIENQMQRYIIGDMPGVSLSRTMCS